MCKYCNGINEEQPTNILSDRTSLGILGDLRTNLELSKMDDEYFLGAYSDFEANDDSFGDCAKIHYCPFCGRKLK